MIHVIEYMVICHIDSKYFPFLTNFRSIWWINPQILAISRITFQIKCKPLQPEYNPSIERNSIIQFQRNRLQDRKRKESIEMAVSNHLTLRYNTS